MTENARRKVAQYKKELSPNNLAKVAYNYFKQETPVKSGNARSKTSLSGDTIYAQYPYAKRLDEGWSRQAPNGMVKPTVEYLRKYIRQRLGR